MAHGRRHLLAVGAALALLASACGDGGQEQPERVQEGGLEGETIEVAAVWTGEEQTKFEEVLDAFAEQTGATVRFTSTGDDVAAVLQTRIEGGNPPDVALLPQPGLLRDLAEQDALQPIEEVAGDEVDANYSPVWRELGSVDETLYGVWFKAANKSTVWYNLNVFSSAGAEPPADWDAFRSTAETIADFGVDPIAVGGADGWTLTDWFENVYIRTAGPDMYDQLANHEIEWTDQSVKDALTTLGEILGDEALLSGGTRGALQTSFPDSVSKVFADPQNPEAAIVYEADFVATVIQNETESELGTDADFFDFPAIDDSPPAVVGGGDVAVLLTESEGGQALIEYLATAEAAEIRARTGGFTSANTGVDLSVYPDEITRRSAEALVEAGDSFRFDLSDLQPAEFGATVGQGLFKLFQDFLQDPEDVDGVTQQLERAASQAFG
jgi:hypothetical protein